MNSRNIILGLLASALFCVALRAVLVAQVMASPRAYACDLQQFDRLDWIAGGCGVGAGIVLIGAFVSRTSRRKIVAGVVGLLILAGAGVGGWIQWSEYERAERERLSKEFNRGFDSHAQYRAAIPADAYWDSLSDEWRNWMILAAKTEAKRIREERDSVTGR